VSFWVHLLTIQQNVVLVYQNILQCLDDSQLPVRVGAALALQPLIRHDFIRKSMQSNIAVIMQQLLKLANEVDVDALSNVMEEFVEVFASELTPFAVELTKQLVCPNLVSGFSDFYYQSSDNCLERHIFADRSGCH
jgi:hypothetical protein